MSEITSANANINVNPDPVSIIPAKYQDYADVFSKTEAHKLLEYQPYNLSILF